MWSSSRLRAGAFRHIFEAQSRRAAIAGLVSTQEGRWVFGGAVVSLLEAFLVHRDFEANPRRTASIRPFPISLKTCPEPSKDAAHAFQGLIEEHQFQQFSAYPHSYWYGFGKGQEPVSHWGSPEKWIQISQVGNLYFTTNEIYETLRDVTRAALSGRLVVVKDEPSLHDLSGRTHTIEMIIAMQHVVMRGMRFVDEGAGKGILSLVASVLGASSFDLFDGYNLDPSIIDQLVRSGTQENDIRLWPADVRHGRGVAEVLKASSGKPTVITCNIGIDRTKNGRNSPYMRVLDEPSLGVYAFLSGGYDLSFFEGIKVDSEELQQRGFSVCPTLASAYSYFVDPTTGQYRGYDATAMIALRQ